MFLALTGFWLYVVAIIAFIIIIGIIICFHEFGHYFFAKKAGILCHEFSFGMGPALYKKQRGETLFAIRAIPIGGYVAMAGEQQTDIYCKPGSNIGLNLVDDVVTEIILDDNKECQVRGQVVRADLSGKDGEALYITILVGETEYYYNVKKDAHFVFEKDQRLQIEPYDRTIDSKNPWQRFITLFAGPMNNMILAIFLYFIISFANGVPNYSSTKVGEISGENYPAYGILEKGDELLSINGNKISSWTEFSQTVDKEYKTTTTLLIEYKHDGVIQPIKEIEAITIIQSIGISNADLKGDDLKAITLESNIKDKKGNPITGLKLGKVGFREKIDVKQNDIITKIHIDYDSTDEALGLVDKDVDATSWVLVTNEFDKITSQATVSFDYYSYNDSDKSYEEMKTSSNTTTYTNEVLESQSVAKIRHLIGISCETHADFFPCIGQAFSYFWSDFTLIFRTLKLLIAPSGVRQIGVSDLSSFVGIYKLVEKYIGAGFIALLTLTALLSVNIGVMNLLPIPALDGGRILFLAIELITRKKVSKKVETVINNVFFVLILVLFVYITVNDIIRLF